jgi:osmotically-inducible protein OsmY
MGQPGIGGIGGDQDQMPPVPQQPKVDDATLLRQVHQQLAARPELANVSVTVDNGWVRLDGSVSRKEDRKRAHELARSVPGVQGVKDKLTVNPNSGSAGASTTGAENNGQFAGSTGTVVSAASSASELRDSGQGGAMAESSGGELARQIADALHQEPNLAHDRIIVSVNDTEITLNGSVANGKEKQTANRIAQSFASNRKVIDAITVTGH